MEILEMLFKVVLIPALGLLTAYGVKFLRAKSVEIQQKVDNDTADKYIAMVADTVEACVITTNQTYVDSLKASGEFTAEAQKEAFRKTFAAVLAILTEDAKEYISEATGDITVYLTQLIEAQVSRQK